MTTRDDTMPHGDPGVEALDRFLDRRAAGDPAPQTGLDPELVRTAQRLQALADATVAANVSGADEARHWEILMRTPIRPRLLAMSPTIETGTPVARESAARSRRVASGRSVPDVPQPSRIVAIGRSAPPSRFRRIGHQSLGLVATLTLFALVGLSSLAVYLSAPQGDDGATAPIVAGATPTTEPVPADLREVIPSNCVQEPRDYDELMRMIRAPWNDGEFERILDLQPQASTIPNPTDPDLDAFQLPDGPAPDEATSRAVASTVSQFYGCQQVHAGNLRAASFTTDDYWYRSAYHSDYGGVDLVLVWSDDQYWSTISPEAQTASPPAGTTIVTAFGGDPLYELYDFRLLDGQRVGAYLSPGSRLTGVGDPSVVAVQPDYDQRGYMVFARGGDGLWLIDEIVSPPFTPAEDCDRVCATPAAP